MNHHHAPEQPKPLSATFPRYSIWTLLRTMAALALGYFLLLAYLHYQSDSDIEDPDIQRLFGGFEGATTLKYVDRVEAYLIDQPTDTKQAAVGLLRYPIRKGPISVPNSDAKALKRSLLDRKSYAWNMGKACQPAYGVRLDFIRSDHRVSVLLCFECDTLSTYLDGEIVAIKDFDGARPTIGPIVRSIFPNDPTFQSLL
jgi:hypothetical protein